MAQRAAAAEAANQVVRYVGSIDVAAGKASIKVARWGSQLSDSRGNALAYFTGIHDCHKAKLFVLNVSYDMSHITRTCIFSMYHMICHITRKFDLQHFLP
jgi:hypothetical protein